MQNAHLQIHPLADGLGRYCLCPQTIVELQGSVWVLAVMLLPPTWTSLPRNETGGGHRLLRTPPSCSSTTYGWHEMSRGSRSPTLSRTSTMAIHWTGCTGGCHSQCHAAGTACSPSMLSHSASATNSGEPYPMHAMPEQHALIKRGGLVPRLQEQVQHTPHMGMPERPARIGEERFACARSPGAPHSHMQCQKGELLSPRSLQPGLQVLVQHWFFACKSPRVHLGLPSQVTCAIKSIKLCSISLK